MTAHLPDGVVVSVTRRYAFVLHEQNEPTLCRIPSSIKEVAVGDRIRSRKENGEVFLEAILPQSNRLRRFYRRDARTIAANLDHLFIVTAPESLFEPLSIDRVLAAAAVEGIPCSLIANKSDIGFSEEAQIIDYYRGFGHQILFTIAIEAEGIAPLEDMLEHSIHLKQVAFVGLSGVGKSTLLNSLVPEAERQTGEVNTRTGRGTQTTTQAYGYRWTRSSGSPLLLIDLPGIQNFGVGYLSKSEVGHAFVDFRDPALHCQYDDCSHTAEPNCGVKAAVQDGHILPSRYNSYCHILEELEQIKPY